MSIDRFVSHLAVMGLARFGGLTTRPHNTAPTSAPVPPPPETPGASPAASRRRTCAAPRQAGGHLQPRIARLAERLASAVGRLLRLRQTALRDVPEPRSSAMRSG
jgi:hypothetical protein